MDKSDIRRLVKAQKALLEVAEQAEAAERAFARFETSAAFMMADNILMYHSLPDEISTHAFWISGMSASTSFCRASMVPTSKSCLMIDHV